MKINANSIKLGNVIEYQNNLWQVLKKKHVKPGKGGAYIQIEMKDIIHGTKTNVRFISTENIEKSYLETKKYQYQYMNGNDLVAMDMETFESFEFHKDLLGDLFPFLEDEMDIFVEYCNYNPILIKIPESIEVKIDHADSVVKGQTATSSFKPAILYNGKRIMVPTFIESGENIIIKTEDFSYIERSKNKN